jgi:hypothetical protein
MATKTGSRWAAMRNKALDMVLHSTTWLGAEDLGDADYQRWVEDNKIFAIDLDGHTYYAAYGLHAVTRDNVRIIEPKPVMAAVIAALGERYTCFQIATWFAAANSRLIGSARPADVLDIEPTQVVEAAKLEAAGIQHG